jgi:S-adenosylmethionine:tRNA ribosyltransferase-isomerase
MRPARWPRDKREDRLLVLDGATGALEHTRFSELSRFLRAGDVLVVNDAATIPAAWAFTRGRDEGELRVLLFDGAHGLEADAVVLGAGHMRERTEDRRPPARLAEGEKLTLAGGATALVIACGPDSPRRVRLRFDGEKREILRALYAFAVPIQYAYVERPLALYNVVLPYAGRPWASEMPSAGRPLDFAALSRLRAGGIQVVAITHGAGISSTGDAALDRALPFPERYAIGSQAAAAIEAARCAGKRIVAVGTSVVRALESAVRASGRIEAGEAVTSLRVGAASERRVVDAVVTGMHEIGTSHFSLLEAFAGRAELEAAVAAGDEGGYLLHEFGDSMLVVAPPRIAAERAA